jgi:murein DD-endopeptidase MepM/ murein hydrolase activator NlpD
MTPPIKNCKWAQYPLGDVTQFLGENVALYKNLGIGIEKGHTGIDLVRPWGEHMFAVEDGVVSGTKSDPGGYGMHIRIKSKDGKREWIYGHMSFIAVKKGDKMREGQYVGNMGNTGFVVSDARGNGYWEANPYKGTHVHFGIREYENGQVKNYDNGLLGYLDPLLFFLDPKKKSTKILKIASDKQDKNLYRIAMWMQSVGL